jgi:hypothetical protein
MAAQETDEVLRGVLATPEIKKLLAEAEARVNRAE